MPSFNFTIHPDARVYLQEATVQRMAALGSSTFIRSGPSTQTYS